LKRREQKLHQRPGGAEHAENLCRLLRVAANEIHHELRQHRNDDADCEHVQKHGREDEDKRSFPSHRADFYFRCVCRPLHQRRFRPA
jgi:hypothetical protein